MTIVISLIGSVGLLVITLSSANIGLGLNPPTPKLGETTFQFRNRLKSFANMVNHLFEALTAFDALGNLLLVPLAILVKPKVGSDPVC